MSIYNTIFRLLTFRLLRGEMQQFTAKHFFAGLAGTWIAGTGRYWDDEHAGLFQHMGLGSVIYIFLLAAFIWLIVKPFKVEEWSYFTVLTFVGLTSFPAVIYAIPVERMVSIDAARSFNVWFLLVVASWRLALLYYFLKTFTRLGIGNIITITLMPICVIITSLTALNLHRVVFNIMGGIREPNAHDNAYYVLMFLTVISVILTLPLLVLYGVGIYNRNRQIKNRN